MKYGRNAKYSVARKKLKDNIYDKQSEAGFFLKNNP